MTADVASSATGGNGGWRVLETGFGLGLNFLATWHAWRQWRAQCPTATPLHFTAVEAWPVQADDIRRSVAALAELAPLAEVLAQRWVGLLPGTHRFNFDEGQVQLTLCIGPVQTLLAQLDTPVDSVFLTHPNANTDGEQWTPATLKAVARLCQPGTRLAAPTLAPPVQDALKQLGFVPDGGTRATAAGATASHGFGATYAPHWPLRRVLRAAAPATGATAAQRRAVVVGGGLSGAAAAYSLAQRGYAVQVLDRSAHPAAGASGLPVGLVAPHTSPDDNVLSRLSRAGVRATLQRCQALLAPGTDWAHSGVLEHRVEGKRGLPAGDAWPEAGLAWSRPAPPETLAAASLPADTPALWHAQAGWLRPAQLVAAAGDGLQLQQGVVVMPGQVQSAGSGQPGHAAPGNQGVDAAGSGGRSTGSGAGVGNRAAGGGIAQGMTALRVLAHKAAADMIQALGQHRLAARQRQGTTGRCGGATQHELAAGPCHACSS